jgi:hypothetical protein
MLRLAMVSFVWLLASHGPLAAEMCLLAPGEGAIAEGKLVVSEGAFILEIEDAICLPGDDEQDRVGPTQRIHLAPDGDKIQQALEQHRGKAISVRGNMFAMHTDSHKAPLVMMTKEVTVK